MFTNWLATLRQSVFWHEYAALLLLLFSLSGHSKVTPAMKSFNPIKWKSMAHPGGDISSNLIPHSGRFFGLTVVMKRFPWGSSSAFFTKAATVVILGVSSATASKLNLSVPLESGTGPRNFFQIFHLWCFTRNLSVVCCNFLEVSVYSSSIIATFFCTRWRWVFTLSLSAVCCNFFLVSVYWPLKIYYLIFVTSSFN